MPLCNVCSTVYFADLPPFPEDQHGNQLTGLEYVHPFLRQRQFPRSPSTSRARHHSSLESLRDEAAAGCELCTLILGQVDTLLAEIEGLTEEQKLRHQTSYTPTMNLWLTRRPYGRQGFWVLSESLRSKDEKELLLVAAFSFAVTKDDPLANTIFGRPVLQNPEIWALRQMVEWNDQCEQNHACYENSGHVPRRLIDVGHTGPGETVKLVEMLPEGQKKYVALSYSLGDRFESGSSSEEQFEFGEISIEPLPKMFRDAILVTRILGAQYLWIDSLCLPGNRTEWERDSEEVGSVYTNAYLTIAATGAGSVTDGLLLTRPARNSILLPYKSHDDDTSPDFITATTLSLRKEALGKYKEMTEEPSSKDLWCFQERVLSRRVVHFASDQLYFECEGHFRSEDGFPQNQRYHTTAKELLAGPDWYREQTALGRWHRIVRDYGQRQLKTPSDKLPGMANIARAFQRLLDDEYIAGLWKSSLMESLCWQSLRCKPMSENVAPSWSWASVDGTAATSIVDCTLLPIATIHDIQVSLESDSKPFSNINSASITIEGPMIPLKLVERENPELWHMFLQPEDGGKDGFYGGFDTIDRRYAVSAEAIQKTKVFALVLANASRETCLIGSCHPRETTRGLLVSHADAGEHTVKRIGSFSTSKEYFSSVDWASFSKRVILV